MSSSAALITERRERTFLVLAGIFLSAMTLLNVVGITRFIQLGPSGARRRGTPLSPHFLMHRPDQ